MFDGGTAEDGEWDSPASIENAKVAVLAMHKEMNFNPQEMFARLEIKADLANYEQGDVSLLR